MNTLIHGLCSDVKAEVNTPVPVLHGWMMSIFIDKSCDEHYDLLQNISFIKSDSAVLLKEYNDPSFTSCGNLISLNPSYLQPSICLHSLLLILNHSAFWE